MSKDSNAGQNEQPKDWSSLRIWAWGGGVLLAGWLLLSSHFAVSPAERIIEPWQGWIVVSRHQPFLYAFLLLGKYLLVPLGVAVALIHIARLFLFSRWAVVLRGGLLALPWMVCGTLLAVHNWGYSDPGSTPTALAGCGLVFVGVVAMIRAVAKYRLGVRGLHKVKLEKPEDRAARDG